MKTLLVPVFLLASLTLATSASALNIALSNDDGWDAPGIQALKTELESHGHMVTLAAPLDQQSGSSAAIDIAIPPEEFLIIKRETSNEYSVAKKTGTEGAEPATSALIAIAISTEANGAAPDLLVTGINSGANVGSATQISGTVGGAIAGLANGFNGSVPAIAISTDEPCDEDDAEPGELPACQAENAAHYAEVAGFTADFIAHLESKPGFLSAESDLLPQGVGLNINYPPLPRAQVAGVKLSNQGRVFTSGGIPLNLEFLCFFGCTTISEGEITFGGIGAADFDPTEDVMNSDVTNFNAGYITVVPIEPDYTAAQSSRFHSVVELFEF
jgi:5'-nucleotidase